MVDNEDILDRIRNGYTYEECIAEIRSLWQEEWGDFSEYEKNYARRQWDELLELL